MRLNICMIDPMGGSSLKEIILSNFDTSKITNRRFMFCSCIFLENQKSVFIIQNINNMEYIFVNCKSIKLISLSTYNI